jgi:hypothetical protein
MLSYHFDLADDIILEAFFHRADTGQNDLHELLFP